MSIQLTEEQEIAVGAAVSAVEMGVEISIGGYAGTGKSVVASAIIGKLDGVVPCAFSGKAVSVMRRKGIESASTIHSLIYELVLPPTDPPQFIRRPYLQCEAILVDEASMVNGQIAEDLRQFRRPIIWVGDHGQLQPIGEDPGIMRSPDVRLEKIHRQAEGNPIISFAHSLRLGQNPEPPASGDLRSANPAWAWDHCHEFDLVLCATNKTRSLINATVRERDGRKKIFEVGDRIICLRNNRELGFFNGQRADVLEIIQPNGDDRREWLLNVELEEGGQRDVTATLCSNSEEVKWVGRSGIAVDYGNCLTVHKAQGSQADNVLVLRERLHPEWDRARWEYTAATRAAKTLIWCKWGS